MDAAELLGENGPLARFVAGFSPRPQQQTLAQSVAQILTQKGILLAEAGTGTGKTYAYLVPVLQSGKKVIISTGTRNLQDQLYHRDLPTVRKALEIPVRVAMLKGRANYLCLHRLQLTAGDGRLPRRQAADLLRIRSWADRTRSGDIAEVSDVAEDSTLWPRVTSSVDNCLGQQCPQIKDCHLLKARRRAVEADVVVINHHLLFADMTLREEGFGELLPSADAVILDEAHQLPEVASHFFGLSLSSRQLNELARDTVAEQLRDAADFMILTELARRLEQTVAELRLALGREPRRAAWHEVAKRPPLVTAVANVTEALNRLRTALQEAAPRGKGLENCCSRSQALLERLQHLTQSDSPDSVHWFETYARSFTLNLTPLEIGPGFQSRMDGYPGAWVFTSATLAVGEDFTHFASRLGLQNSNSLRLESPFNFTYNALLYHPQGLPDPSTPDYTPGLIEAALPVLEASRGRAFLLFTSHRALREAATLLEGRLGYPLLIQGSLPKGELLTRFRSLGNAVLLGTASFWEGVDVRGPALSCVIIAKLPFAAPADPVLQARLEALRRRGVDPFLEFQLPQAVIALKQGVGRLIRDVHDRGVLMLCDPRLLTKPYGRVFLDSLPPMTRTRKLERVRRFFALEESSAPESMTNG